MALIEKLRKSLIFKHPTPKPDIINSIELLPKELFKMTITFAHNLREANGKTIRENNMEKTHAIPLGTLVEINLDYNDEHGCRLFVVQHTRDCDGTPLYTLSHDKNAGTDLAKYQSQVCENDFDDYMNRLCIEGLKGSMTGGWSDDCLIVVR